MIAWVLSACTSDPAPDAPADTDVVAQAVPWSRDVPVLPPGPRGWTQKRAIIHLHSPWSHDACDGDPLPDGVPNEPCLQDLRAALCADRIDLAFVTDHPAHAAEQPYEDLFHQRPGDAWVEVDGVRVGNRITCDNGHAATWMPGIEDELMPVSLDRQVAGDDAAENDRIYNAYDDAAVAADLDAGAAVLIAHTEQRDPADLERLQDAGVTGVELFNLHAMFDPDIRADFLGLEALGWTDGIAPFASPDATGEPDLMFLGVLEEQTVSIAKWDALLQRGPAVAVGGSDAHQNVLAIDLRDGERGDSYRRVLRWFSNRLLVDGDGPDAAQQALEAGRVAVVMEVLGSPVGFDFALRDAAGRVYEMGSDAPHGALVVSCPTLDPASPRGDEDPQIAVTVFKDGVAWADGCGEHTPDGPGAYRVRVDLVPAHLRPFLGEDPDPWMKPTPWIYSNAIRVVM